MNDYVGGTEILLSEEYIKTDPETGARLRGARMPRHAATGPVTSRGQLGVESRDGSCRV
jgi:hypothetical protein